MQRDILREAYKHWFLVEDILAPVEHSPSKHGGREAVDAARRVLPRRCALVDDAQLALGSVIQADAPLEKIANDYPCRRALHRGPDPLDAPLVTLAKVLLRCTAQDAGLFAAPVPLLRLPQEVARRLHLRVLEAEHDDPLRVGVRAHVVARRPQDLSEVLPRDAQQVVMHRGQHLEEVVADELADAGLQQRVPRQALVLHHGDAVLRRQSRQDEWLDVRRIQRLDPKLLRQPQHVKAIIGSKAVIGNPSKVHEADKCVHDLELVV
mmetsp:Transcript_105868/g.299230  ORF Transcript_105868/g.299230 Transcript_105868/m.299230 type:complete len:265 (+) Transcript_105868:362-1156(+)